MLRYSEYNRSGEVIRSLDASPELDRAIALAFNGRTRRFRLGGYRVRLLRNGAGIRYRGRVFGARVSVLTHIYIAEGEIDEESDPLVEDTDSDSSPMETLQNESCIAS
jgi:hypothetical protein